MAGLSDFVQGTCTIGDVGLNPHAPARLVIKGVPRKIIARVLGAPNYPATGGAASWADG